MPTIISAFLAVADVTAAFSPAQLIELLDDPVNPTGALNTARRDQIIARVNGEASSLTARKLQFPMTVDDADVANVRATLVGFALDMFRYHAIKDRPHALEAYRGIVAGYDRAVSWLQDISDGRAAIGTSKTLPGAEARTAGTLSTAQDRTFTRDRLGGL